MKLRFIKLVEQDFFESDIRGEEKFTTETESKKDILLASPESEFHWLEVPRSATVLHVKHKLAKMESCEAHNIQVFFRSKQVGNRWHLGTNLPDGDSLVYTVVTNPRPCKMKIVGLHSLKSLTSKRQKTLQNTLQEVQAGLDANIDPELAMEGSGGTYFLKNLPGSRVACFKPQDEEPSAHNNPRDVSTAGQREGVQPGEAAEREVAAFITDEGGFSNVPETIMVEIAHPVFKYPDGQVVPKKGSLQRYVSGDCASDFSTHLFPVDEVHRIGILDIRLLNSDRNDANLLVQRVPKANPMVLAGERSNFGSSSNLDVEGKECKSSMAGYGSMLRKTRSCSASSAADYEYKLVPIDHGFCLPDRLQISWYDLCWLDWPQARQPFSEATKEWVRRYDVDATVDKLRRELNIREPCLRLVKIAGILLKKGVEAGLCLHDIASIIVRQDIDSPSALEKQIARCTELTNMMLQNARVKGLSFESSDTDSLPASNESDDGSSTITARSKKGNRRRQVVLSSSVLPKVDIEDSEPVGTYHTTGRPIYEPGITLKLPSNNSSKCKGGPPSSSASSCEEVGSSASSSYSSVSTASTTVEKTPFNRQRVASSPNVAGFSLIRVNSDGDLHSNTSSPQWEPQNDQPPGGSVKAKSMKKFGLSRKMESLDSLMEKGVDGDCSVVRSRANTQKSEVEDDMLEESPNDRFNRFFFTYLERLLDDVIVCVQKHRKKDNSLFRRASALHLTSPHRGPPLWETRSRCESMSSFFAHEEVGELSGKPLVLSTVDGAAISSSDFSLHKAPIRATVESHESKSALPDRSNTLFLHRRAHHVGEENGNRGNNAMDLPPKPPLQPPKSKDGKLGIGEQGNHRRLPIPGSRPAYARNPHPSLPRWGSAPDVPNLAE